MKSLLTTLVGFFTIVTSYSQNVGIGTTTPAYKLTVQTQTNQFGLAHTDGTVTLSSYIGVFNGALGGWLGTRSNHPLYFFTNNGAQQMTILPNGNVGIGTINPSNKLQIGNTSGFSSYDLAIGNGTQGMVFQQNGGFSNWQSNTSITLLPTNATGNVGINTTGPTNHLQIGNNPGFSGYDLAIGNGTQGMVFQQNAGFSNWQSNTNITMLPANGIGRVGINTISPRAPLDVVGVVAAPAQDYSYLNANSNSSGVSAVFYCGTCNSQASIVASDAILAKEFDAFSDARIKDIRGTSNKIEDLNIINALRVRDYTMKDKVKYGNKQYKKVVAQEVEKIYPQVVSKHTDFIPNVYQLSNKIRRIENGYLLSFEKEHRISNNAKKLQILFEGSSGMEQANIVAIPSGHEVVIDAAGIKGDKVFVYGEEVDDFRTVDYEGLTTLNISATQELSKQLKKQQQQIKIQQQQIMMLVSEIKLLKRNSNKLTSIKPNVINSRTKKIKS